MFRYICTAAVKPMSAGACLQQRYITTKIEKSYKRPTQRVSIVGRAQRLLDDDDDIVDKRKYGQAIR